MGIKHGKQVHAGFSKGWIDRIDEIAEAESLSRSELMRRVLLDFIRSYQPNDPRLLPPRKAAKISGTGTVPDRYKMP